MSLEIIVGPMKGGKTEILCANVGPFKHSCEQYVGFSPSSDKRTKVIQSRTGAKLDNTIKINSIEDIIPLIDEIKPKAVAIDEFHFFDPIKLGKTLNKILIEKPNIKMFAAGLDKDYKGQILNAFKELLQLPYDKINFRHAVCDDCKIYNATNTMIKMDGVYLSSGLPQPIPEDATCEYIFSAHCKKCFDKNMASAKPYDVVKNHVLREKLVGLQEKFLSGNK